MTLLRKGSLIVGTVVVAGIGTVVAAGAVGSTAATGPRETIPAEFPESGTTIAPGSIPDSVGVTPSGVPYEIHFSESQEEFCIDVRTLDSSGSSSGSCFGRSAPTDGRVNLGGHVAGGGEIIYAVLEPEADRLEVHRMADGAHAAANALTASDGVRIAHLALPRLARSGAISLSALEAVVTDRTDVPLERVRTDQLEPQGPASPPEPQEPASPPEPQEPASPPELQEPASPQQHIDHVHE
jgi:hypothetical protein